MSIRPFKSCAVASSLVTASLLGWKEESGHLQNNGGKWCLVIWQTATVWPWRRPWQWPVWQEVEQHSPVVKTYWVQWDSLELRDGILKRMLKTPDWMEDRTQIVIPRCQYVLQEVHDGITRAGGRYENHRKVKGTIFLGELPYWFYWVVQEMHD